MNKSQSYLVFLSPNVVPYLQSIGIFGIDKIDNCDYIACSNIHLNHHYLELTISRYHLWNQTDNDFSISIPHHFVMYTCAAHGADLKQIPGFRKS